MLIRRRIIIRRIFLVGQVRYDVRLNYFVGLDPGIHLAPFHEARGSFAQQLSYLRGLDEVICALPTSALPVPKAAALESIV